jgi:hypothetical protein
MSGTDEQIELHRSTGSESKAHPSDESLGNLIPSDAITCVSHVIGEFGPWQRRFFTYFTLMYMLNVYHNFGIIFFGARSDFWCRDRVHGNMTSDDWSQVRNKCFDDCSRYDVDTSTYRRTIFSEVSRLTVCQCSNAQIELVQH